jgi:hypothetical protein
LKYGSEFIEGFIFAVSKGVIMRGGKRSGAGRKPLESTVRVRVPLGVLEQVIALIHEYKALQKVVPEIKQDESEPFLDSVPEIKQGKPHGELEPALESVPEIKQDGLEPELKSVPEIKQSEPEPDMKAVPEIKVQQKLKAFRKLSSAKQRDLRKQHGGLYNAAVYEVQCDIDRDKVLRSYFRPD